MPRPSAKYVVAAAAYRLRRHNGSCTSAAAPSPVPAAGTTSDAVVDPLPARRRRRSQRSPPRRSARCATVGTGVGAGATEFRERPVSLCECGEDILACRLLLARLEQVRSSHSQTLGDRLARHLVAPPSGARAQRSFPRPCRSWADGLSLRPPELAQCRTQACLPSRKHTLARLSVPICLSISWCACHAESGGGVPERCVVVVSGRRSSSSHAARLLCGQRELRVSTTAQSSAVTRG